MKKVLFSLFLLSVVLGCQQANPGTIKIGGIFALTGDGAVYGQPMKQAVDLAVEEINAGGGIDGKQIRMIWEDGKCEPQSASVAAQKLVNEDRVVAIVGGMCSSETLAAAPIAEAAGVPLLSPSSTSPDIKQAGEYIFRNVVSDDFQGAVGAQLVMDKGYRDAAVLYINNDYGVGLKNVFRDELLARGGNVVATESFDVSATDIRTQLLKATSKDPDVIYVIPYAVECSQILKQKEELGIDTQFIASDGCKDDSVIETAGEGAERLLLTFPKSNVDDNYQQFTASYVQQYGSKPSLYTAESYDALKILATAIGNSDGTRAGIKDALYRVQNYPGASGPTSFDAFGEVQKPYAQLEVIKGEFVEQS